MKSAKSHNCLVAGVVLAYISALRQKAVYRFRQFKDKVSKSMKMSSILGQFKESGEWTGLNILHIFKTLLLYKLGLKLFVS